MVKAIEVINDELHMIQELGKLGINEDEFILTATGCIVDVLNEYTLDELSPAIFLNFCDLDYGLELCIGSKLKNHHFNLAIFFIRKHYKTGVNLEEFFINPLRSVCDLVYEKKSEKKSENSGDLGVKKEG